MTAAARAQIQTPILRTASGEPPLGIGGLAFRNEQGEVFKPENSYAAAGWIGVLELEDGQWLAQPPGFRIDAEQFSSRDLALRTAIARMIRKARRYVRAKEGEGTHWTEGFAGRVIEWALALKPERDARVKPGHEEITHAANVDNGLAAESASEEITDPVVAELVAAHRLRKQFPAKHAISMTSANVNGQFKNIGTCACGVVMSHSNYEHLDAAIEAHWRRFHYDDMVDGRGEPIKPGDASRIPQAKKSRKRKTDKTPAPEGMPAPVPASSSFDLEGAGAPDIAEAACPPALRSVDDANASRPEPAPSPGPPDGAGSLISAAQICAASTEVSEPLGKLALSNAEADPVREAGLHGGSLALEMAAEPDADWSPLLTAALDLAWREPPQVRESLAALLDFSKVYGGEVERPVLRWHGGKWRLAPWIISHFPEHRVYVEPFGGAASVLLRKRRSYAEVYNDLDREVISFFRILQNTEQSARLIDLLYLTPFSREEFELGYKESSDAIERARRLVIRAFMGHGSDSMAGVISGFRANSNKSGTTPAHDWANYVTALPLAIERMRGVVIEQRDAVQVMASHDAETTLHYVDPPYLPETRSWMTSGKGKGNYRHELDPEGHARLLDAVRDLKGMVVLSGYPNELYEGALTDWRHVEIAAFADGARPRIEVLWLNPACVAALDQQHPALFDIAALDAVNTPPPSGLAQVEA